MLHARDDYNRIQDPDGDPAGISGDPTDDEESRASAAIDRYHELGMPELAMVTMVMLETYLSRTESLNTGLRRES